MEDGIKAGLRLGGWWQLHLEAVRVTPFCPCDREDLNRGPGAILVSNLPSLLSDPWPAAPRGDTGSGGSLRS